MSDLRLSNTFQMPNLVQNPLGFGPNPTLNPVVPQFQTPGLQLTSANDLTGLFSTQLASNPTSALPLLGQQGNVAAEITGQPAAEQGQTAAKTAEEVARGTDTIASKSSIWLEHIGEGAGKAGRKLGVLGPAAGVIGEAVALPAGFKSAKESIGKAIETGSREDIIKAGGDTAAVGSGATSLVKGLVEIPEAIVKNGARAAATDAFKQVAPNASKKVVKAAADTAAKAALEDTAAKAAKRAVTAEATKAAGKAGSIAAGTGTAGRAAAKAVLKEGGEVAAKAAAEAVGKSALKTAAKAGGRFIPGLNVGIAALDSAAAAATLADPKASAGKKGASLVTAAGSIVAATNIPVVSQVGAAVSAAASFVGAFL